MATSARDKVPDFKPGTYENLHIKVGAVDNAQLDENGRERHVILNLGSQSERISQEDPQVLNLRDFANGSGRFITTGPKHQPAPPGARPSTVPSPKEPPAWNPQDFARSETPPRSIVLPKIPTQDLPEKDFRQPGAPGAVTDRTDMEESRNRRMRSARVPPSGGGTVLTARINKIHRHAGHTGGSPSRQGGTLQGGGGSPPRSAPGGAVRMVSTAVQAAATPWTRFYFPGSDSTGGSNVCYKHFDVVELPPLPKDFPKGRLIDPVPEWLEEDWQKLYYQQTTSQLGEGPAWPEVSLFSSKTFDAAASAKLRKSAKLDDPQAYRPMEFEDFCQMVLRLQPRSQADKEPLNAMRNGICKHVVEQLSQVHAVMQQRFEERERLIREEFQAKIIQLKEETVQVREGAGREKERLRAQYDQDREELLEMAWNESRDAKASLEAQEETNRLLQKRQAEHEQEEKQGFFLSMSKGKTAKALQAKFALRWHRIKWNRLLDRVRRLEPHLEMVEGELSDSHEKIEQMQAKLDDMHVHAVKLAEERDEKVKLAGKANDYWEEVVFLRGQIDNYTAGYKKRIAQMQSGSKEQVAEAAALLKTRIQMLTHTYEAQIHEIEELHTTEMAKKEEEFQDLAKKCGESVAAAYDAQETIRVLKLELAQKNVSNIGERQNYTVKMSEMKKQLNQALFSLAESNQRSPRGPGHQLEAKEKELQDLLEEFKRLQEDAGDTESALVQSMAEAERVARAELKAQEALLREQQRVDLLLGKFKDKLDNVSKHWPAAKRILALNQKTLEAAEGLVKEDPLIQMMKSLSNTQNLLNNISSKSLQTGAAFGEPGNLASAMATKSLAKQWRKKQKDRTKELKKQLEMEEMDFIVPIEEDKKPIERTPELAEREQLTQLVKALVWENRELVGGIRAARATLRARTDPRACRSTWQASCTAVQEDKPKRSQTLQRTLESFQPSLKEVVAAAREINEHKESHSEHTLAVHQRIGKLQTDLLKILSAIKIFPNMSSKIEAFESQFSDLDKERSVLQEGTQHLHTMTPHTLEKGADLGSTAFTKEGSVTETGTGTGTEGKSGTESGTGTGSAGPPVVGDAVATKDVMEMDVDTAEEFSIIKGASAAFQTRARIKDLMQKAADGEVGKRVEGLVTKIQAGLKEFMEDVAREHSKVEWLQEDMVRAMDIMTKLQTSVDQAVALPSSQPASIHPDVTADFCQALNLERLITQAESLMPKPSAGTKWGDVECKEDEDSLELGAITCQVGEGLFASLRALQSLDSALRRAWLGEELSHNEDRATRGFNQMGLALTSLPSPRRVSKLFQQIEAKKSFEGIMEGEGEGDEDAESYNARASEHIIALGDDVKKLQSCLEQYRGFVALAMHDFSIPEEMLTFDEDHALPEQLSTSDNRFDRVRKLWGYLKSMVKSEGMVQGFRRGAFRKSEIVNEDGTITRHEHPESESRESSKSRSNSPPKNPTASSRAQSRGGRSEQSDHRGGGGGSDGGEAGPVSSRRSSGSRAQSRPESKTGGGSDYSRAQSRGSEHKSLHSRSGSHGGGGGGGGNLTPGSEDGGSEEQQGGRKGGSGGRRRSQSREAGSRPQSVRQGEEEEDEEAGEREDDQPMSAMSPPEAENEPAVDHSQEEAEEEMQEDIPDDDSLASPSRPVSIHQSPGGDAGAPPLSSSSTPAKDPAVSSHHSARPPSHSGSSSRPQSYRMSPPTSRSMMTSPMVQIVRMDAACSPYPDDPTLPPPATREIGTSPIPQLGRKLSPEPPDSLPPAGADKMRTLRRSKHVVKVAMGGLRAAVKMVAAGKCRMSQEDAGAFRTALFSQDASAKVHALIAPLVSNDNEDTSSKGTAWTISNALAKLNIAGKQYLCRTLSSGSASEGELQDLLEQALRECGMLATQDDILEDEEEEVVHKQRPTKAVKVEVSAALVSLLMPQGPAQSLQSMHDLQSLSQKALEVLYNLHGLRGVVCQLVKDHTAGEAILYDFLTETLRVVASTSVTHRLQSQLEHDPTSPQYRAIKTLKVVDYMKTDGVKVRVTPLMPPPPAQEVPDLPGLPQCWGEITVEKIAAGVPSHQELADTNFVAEALSRCISELLQIQSQGGGELGWGSEEAGLPTAARAASAREKKEQLKTAKDKTVAMLEQSSHLKDMLKELKSYREVQMPVVATLLGALVLTGEYDLYHLIAQNNHQFPTNRHKLKELWDVVRLRIGSTRKDDGGVSATPRLVASSLTQRLRLFDPVRDTPKLPQGALHLCKALHGMFPAEVVCNASVVTAVIQKWLGTSLDIIQKDAMLNEQPI